MTDRPNIFADAENVGQLFDALWYHAVSATLVEGLTAAKEDRSWDNTNVQREREIAIADAHKRFNELGDAAVAKLKS